jgi:thiaminase/transcriptional activator TenA
MSWDRRIDAEPMGVRYFTQELWSRVETIFDAILSHEFILGLTDGSLPKESFEFYVIQDSHYLRGFARALSLAAAKAPSDEWAVTLNRHASEALEVERQLHDSFFRDFELTPEEVHRTPLAPTTSAYTHYLLVVAYGRPFAEVISVLLPCYWVYAEVGKALVAKGSPQPLYQRWIDTYAGEEYEAVVDTVLDMTERVAESAGHGVREVMADHFVASTRYEWMFWDSAYRREAWPI